MNFKDFTTKQQSALGKKGRAASPWNRGPICGTKGAAKKWTPKKEPKP
jgi:hypothetical protein